MTTPRWRAVLRSFGTMSSSNGEVVGPSAPAHAMTAPLQAAPALRGSAIVQRGDSTETNVFLSVSGLPVGQAIGWRVAEGACSSVGSTIGSPTAYAPIMPSADGNAEALATLRIPTPSVGSYSVVLVRRGGEAMLACGELARAQ